MVLDPIKNFAKVSVSIGYDASATTIVLATGEGAKLPQPSTDGAFNLVWHNVTDYPDPSNDPNVEIIRVTARTTDTLTVTRAQESTTAKTHNTSGKSYQMILGITKNTIDSIDLKINEKLNKNTAITGATKTKVTYDANGLITAGVDATTADIADSADKRYVTDAEKVKLGNLSGTNTGDQTDISGTSGKTNALNSATTVVNVSSATAPSTGQVLTATDSTHATWQTPSTGSAFWTALAGTRASNTSFTVGSDVTGFIKEKTIVKWTESAAVKCAMVLSATYSSPNTTVTIVGDTMASIDANSLKYAILEATTLNFAYAGTIGATATDCMNAYYADEPYRVLAAKPAVGTAGTTNNTTFDINKGGTTMFTTKPTIATTATTGTFFTADNGTSLALNDKVTIDIDAVQTTPAIDAYVRLYVFPTKFLSL